MSIVIRSGLSFLKPTIPPVYVPLEYIRSTGTECIDTEIKPSSDMIFEIEYQVMKDTTKGQKLYGCEDSASSLFDAFNVKKASASIRAFAHNDGSGHGVITNISTNADQKTKLKLEIKNGNYTVYVNDVSYPQVAAKGTVPNRTIYLFGSHRYNSNKGDYMDYPISARVYSCRIYISGSLVGDFKPCITPNGEAGMFNVVTNKFHNNINTGEFIVGYGGVE